MGAKVSKAEGKCQHCATRPGPEAVHYAKDGPAPQVADDLQRLRAWADAAQVDGCEDCCDRAVCMLAYEDFEVSHG